MPTATLKDAQQYEQDEAEYEYPERLQYSGYEITEQSRAIADFGKVINRTSLSHLASGPVLQLKGNEQPFPYFANDIERFEPRKGLVGGDNLSLQQWLDEFVRRFAVAAVIVLKRGLTNLPKQNVSINRGQGSLVTEDSFIVRAHRLDAKGRTGAALDLIYDQVDEMMLAGRFDELDSLLNSSNLENLSTSLLLGLLTASLPGRGRLTARKNLFERASSILEHRGEMKPGLLSGLEEV
ncbi:MAG: hypothetical protein NUW37_19445 [Planctomycetes bacterium]|nr:hypothetical protein [Planctomycetota bacterium]